VLGTLVVGVIAISAGSFVIFMIAIVIGAIGWFLAEPYKLTACPHCGRIMSNPGPVCRACGQDMRMS
jgi:hypothetical protein